MRYLIRLGVFVGFLASSYSAFPVQAQSKQYQNYEELQTALLNRISGAQRNVFVAGRKLHDNAIASALFLAKYRGVEVSVYLDPADVELFKRTTRFLKEHSLPVLQLKSGMIADGMSLVLVDNELIRIPGYLSDRGTKKTYLVSYRLKPKEQPRKVFLDVIRANDQPTQARTQVKETVSKGGKEAKIAKKSGRARVYNYDRVKTPKKPENLQRGLPEEPIWRVRDQQGSGEEIPAVDGAKDSSHDSLKGGQK